MQELKRTHGQRTSLQSAKEPDRVNIVAGLMFSTSLTINHLISMSHYNWKALKKENCTPPPLQYMYMGRCTECHRKYKIGPVVYLVQILEEILTQTVCSLPLVVEEVPTNQWKISWSSRKMFLLLSVKLYLRTKVLHGCCTCKPVFITLRLYTNLTLPVIEVRATKSLTPKALCSAIIKL